MNLIYSNPLPGSILNLQLSSHKISVTHPYQTSTTLHKNTPLNQKLLGIADYVFNFIKDVINSTKKVIKSLGELL